MNRATRLTSLASSLVDTAHPGTLISAVHYNASGGVVSATMGNSISETRTYDGRERLSTITDGSAYSVTIPSPGGYAPDGDILAANDSANANWSYLYDDFNRLIKATPSGQSWFYTYAYDRYGNRWQQTLNGTGGSGPTSSLTFDANNHIASGNNVTYDAAGNVTADPTNTYVYDAESRITSTTNTHTGVVSSYVYDAAGQRVRKTSGSVSLDYIYDLAGRVVAEVNSTGGWTRGEVFAGGRHLATYNNNTTYFIHADWLGTERARSNTAGTSCETITSLPFGDNQATSGTCSDASPLHFTGKQRDPESSNDDFGARYYSSQFGRWTSADWSAIPAPVPYANLSNPQTLNLYAMVGDNPTTFADLNGHCWPVCEVIAWVATHVAQVGIGISSTRNEYTARAAQATSSGERDALKVEMRAKGPALGRALADNAAGDPARIAARAAKTEAQLTESITHTSAGVSATADAMGIVGKVAAPVAVGIAAYDVATAPEGEKGRTAAGEAGGLGGALAGGEVGAEAGAIVGSFFGPGPGTAIGAGIGGLIGAIGGGLVGNNSATNVYDNITNRKAP